MPSHLTVNLRQQPSGGDALDHREIGEQVAYPRNLLLLLIHGYNVSRKEAAQSYTDFEKNLAKYSQVLADNCCWMFWPGDAWMPLLRKAAYPWRLKHAVECAVELADFILARKRANG